MHIIFFPLKSHSAEFNMAFDTQIAESIDDYADFVLRFYEWERPTISLGFHQTDTQINHTLRLKEGVDLVRRPTGGRAVFHVNEITYSIIVKKKWINRKDLYLRSHQAFANAIQHLGIHAELEKTKNKMGSFSEQRDQISCFNSSARHEVEIAGKKLIGSAQREFKDSLLQHGSILCGPEHLNLVNYLIVDDSEKVKLKHRLLNESAFLDLDHIKLKKSEICDILKYYLEQEFKLNRISIDNPKESC